MNAKVVIKAIKAIRSLISKDKEGNSVGKKVLIFCLCGFMLLIIVPVAALSAPGLIFKGILSSFFSVKDNNTDVNVDVEISTDIDEAFDIRKSEIYSLVKDVYIDFNAKLDQDVNNFVQDLTSEYTYTYEYSSPVYRKDGSGNIIKDKHGAPVIDNYIKQSSTVAPEIKKSIELYKPEIQLVLAYISIKYADIMIESDEYTFDADEVFNFLDEITELNMTSSLVQDCIDGNSKVVKCNIYSSILSDIDIANSYFSPELYPEDYDDRQQQYIFSYESLADIDDVDVLNSYSYIDLSTFVFHANGMEIPHFLQYDDRWGALNYGTSNMSRCGCCPTCIAMCVSYLNNLTITPYDVASWSNDRYYVSGIGTSWTIFSGVEVTYNIRCMNLGKNAKEIIAALSDGKPVIASVSAGTFTNNGHFIVLRGITTDGKILVNDPNDNESKKFYEKEFILACIINEAKNFWALSNND